jgi:hypothetical protein
MHMNVVACRSSCVVYPVWLGHGRLEAPVVSVIRSSVKVPCPQKEGLTRSD